MKLAKLLHLAREMPAYRQLIEKLNQLDGGTTASVLDAAKPYLIAALFRELRLPTLVVTAQPENSRRLQEQISAWSNSQVRLFPEPDVLPYQRIVSDTSKNAFIHTFSADRLNCRRFYDIILA